LDVINERAARMVADLYICPSCRYMEVNTWLKQLLYYGNKYLAHQQLL